MSGDEASGGGEANGETKDDELYDVLHGRLMASRTTPNNNLVEERWIKIGD